MKLITTIALLFLTCSPAFADRTLEAVERLSNISRAVDEIKNTYSQDVRWENKRKSLVKFGSSASVGTTFETIATLQGTELNETFVSTNLIDEAVSTNAGDTMTLVLEGHTIDVSGNLIFVVQDVVMTGTTPAAIGTPLARATRAYIKPSGVFNAPQSLPLGIISFYDNTDGQAAGTPTTAAATKLILPIGMSQTEKCATSVSSTDYWVITEGYFGAGQSGGSASTITFRIQTRDVANGGQWRPLGALFTVPVKGGSISAKFDTARIVPKNHDVRVQAATDANTSAAFAELEGVLLLVQ